MRPADDGLRDLLANPTDFSPVVQKILTFGLYGQHLRHYLDYFPPESLHVVLHDDLASDYAASIARLETALGISRSSTTPEPAGANASVHSPVRLRWLRRRNRYVVQTSSDGTDARIVPPETLTGRVVSLGVAAVDRWMLAHVVDNRRPEIGVTLKRRLEDYYAEDRVVLEALLVRDLTDWKAVT